MKRRTCTSTKQLKIGEVYERSSKDGGTELDTVHKIITNLTYEGREGVINITQTKVYLR